MSMTQEPIDWDEDVVVDNAEVYESLVRAIGLTEGFGLFLVRSGNAVELGQRLRADLPKLMFADLELTEELKDGNLYRKVKEISQAVGPLNGVIISGLEKSLDPYVKSGYGGLGDYYNKDMVPRILGHLNLQRERLRDDFPFCLIFVLSAFGIKYIARRAPDFFDWRSGLFEFVPDADTLGKLTQEMCGNYDQYLTWTHDQRIDRIREIQALIDEDQQTVNSKTSLFFEKGNILVADQSYKESIESYEKASELKPDSYETWSNRGISLDELGRNEEAIESYEKAIELKPDSYEAWYNRGISLDELGRNEEAIESYEKAIELKPDDHQTWSKRGNSLYRLGRNEEAIESFDKAIEFKPDDDDAWSLRGILLSKLGRKEEAIASYKKAIEIKPDLHEVLSLQGISLSELGRNEEAIASYEKAIEINPDYHEAWFIRGILLSKLGRNEEAIASYEKVIEINPDKYEAWDNRGYALFCQQKYAEAIDSYNQAIKINPTYANAYYNRACAQGFQGDFDRAISDLTEAIRLEPERYRKLAATDRDFEPLRGDSRFLRMLN
jgi:tetratricopeptide (TPR) repeat protein